MQLLLNNIGDWLILVWITTRDILMSLSPLTAALIATVFVVITMLSIMGIFSRLTDFVVNTGIVLSLTEVFTVPIGLMLALTAQTSLGTAVLLILQTTYLIGYVVLSLLGVIFTVQMLYFGKPHSSFLQFFSE